MPPTRMTVNGIDLSTYNLWVETPRGWLDSPRRSERLVDVQGAGSALITEAARIGERTISVDGILSTVDFASAAALWDQVRQHLSSPWLEVMFEPFTDRMAVCRYQDFQWQGTNWAMGGWRFLLTLLSPSAWLVAPSVDTYMLAPGIDQPITLGTAPSPFMVEFIGPATSPTLTYTDVNGQRVGNFQLTVDLLAREWFRYESQGHAMEFHNALGVAANGAPYFGTSSRQFQLDPLDGVPERGPTLTVDSGNALVYVRRAFR